jgi:predicted permease
MLEDLDQDIRDHIERETQDNIERGMSPEEAHDAALRKFGNVTRVKEETREVWSVVWLEQLLQDLRFSLRMLRKSPSFTAAAVLTLALGIGANTTIFGLADALLFRPFPVAEPGRLVVLMRQMVEQSDYYSSFSYPDYQDLRGQTRALSSLAAFDSISVSIAMNGEATRIDGEIVSGNYFSVLGIRPALGRAFLPEEDQVAGSHPVIVASDDFWRDRLNADREIIGRSLILNGRSFTVIGVAPAGFHGLSVGSSPAFWVPLAMHDQAMPSFTFEGQSLFYARGCDWLDLVGRLEPGRTVAEAEAEMRTLASREAAVYPEARKGWTVVVSPLNQERLRPWNADTTKLMGLLMAVVGLVLLIACSNVAGLLLARASARRMEVGVRAGLGARRGRLVRQLLTESLMLSALGGASALVLASLASRMLTTFRPPGIDMAALGLGVDWRVLSFTFTLAVLTAIVFGIVPAVQTSKVDVAETLRGSPRVVGSDKPRFRQTLVVSQIALSILLLTGSGLLIRTFRNLLQMDLGFDGRNLLLASVDLGLEGYTEARARQFYPQVLERVQESAGVHSACWASTAPLSGWHIADDVVLEDSGRLGRDQRINVDMNWVSPGFFSTLGIPIVAGRDFTSQDREGVQRVAIVTESTARRFWPSENPVGRHFWMNARGNQPGLEVVGVVKDGKYYNSWRKDSARPFVFLAFNQAFQSQGTLLVRRETGIGNLAISIRREIQAMDPNLPIFDIETFQQQFQEGFLFERVGAILVGAFGGLALALAAVGIFGLVSYSVGQRTHEIGVRVALGAQRRDLVGLVLRQGLALTAMGVAAGLSTAVGLTRLLSNFIYGVRPTDLLTLTLATLIVAGVALVSCYVPARRAAKVDPMVALRHE